MSIVNEVTFWVRYSIRRYALSGANRWFAVLLLLPALVNAQSPKLSLTHLSVENGLSNATINCIIQDKRGFMWFATNDGLNRYDGHTFTIFRPDPAHPTTSFRDNRVMSVYEDRQGVLWATTAGGGLHQIDPMTGQVTAHYIPGADAGQRNNQLSTYQDERGHLWVGTWGGLVRYEPDQRHFTLYASPIPRFVVKQIVEDRQHRMWLVTNDGLYQFDPTTCHYARVPEQENDKPHPNLDYLYIDPQDPNQLWISSVGRGLFQLRLDAPSLVLQPYITRQGPLNPFLFMYALLRNQQGQLLVGSSDGLQQIDLASRQLVTYRPNPNQRDGLSSVYIQVIFIDRSGALWLGTNNGLDRQTATTALFSTYQVTPASQFTNFFENKAPALLTDEQDNLWFTNSIVLYRLNRKTNRLTTIPAKTLGSTDQQVNYISALLDDKASGLWINSSQGLYHYDQPSDRYTFYPCPIILDHTSLGPSGLIWLGGEDGFASFDPRTRRYTDYNWLLSQKNGLAQHPVQTLLASRTGDIWLALLGYGLIRFTPATGQYQTFRGQLADDVLALYEDEQGLLWAGTNQSGLQRYDPKTNQFQSFTTREGLPTNRIVSIAADTRGRLWLGTDRGLCRFEPATKGTCLFDTRDGLPSNEFLPTAVIRHHDKLIFGTVNGIVTVDPNLLTRKSNAFPVYITGVSVNNKPYPLQKELLQLSHDQNTISFDFVALTQRSPDGDRYAYRLSDLDDDWVMVGNRRFANYTNLPPGTYRFDVKAVNSDGVWSTEPASYRFVIQAPWWATGWTYMVYVVALAGLVWLGVRLYSHRLHRQQQQELDRQKLEQMQEVEQLKTRFFTNITHELRTPLTLILAPVSMLLNDLSATPHAKLLGTIQRNAQQLLNLINQLLDFARLEAQQLPLRLRQGRPDRFVADIVNAFTASALPNQAIIRYQTALTANYWYDAEKLERILTNLLANAIRYTPPTGQIRVELLPATVGIELIVADTGAGIAADQLAFIFDRFYQVPVADSDSTGPAGSGLGLSLVHELVLLHGGQITVQSEVGTGTTFRVALPYEVAPPSNVDDEDITQPMTLTDNQTGTESATLLLVEDNDEVADFVGLLLQPHYQFQRAANGAAGLQLAIDDLPDLIITDVMMPVMDGLTLVDRLKTDERTSHIPVIMLTAKASVDSRIAGLSTGADDYLTKPFNPEELLLRVRNLLQRQALLRERLRNELIADGSSADPVAPVSDPLLQRLYELIETRLDDTTLTVDQVAEQLHLSRSSVHRRVKALTGLSVTELIRSYRLRRATQWLAQGSTSSQAAYAVGFDSPAYFSKVFREQYGMTPLDYARQQTQPSNWNN